MYNILATFTTVRRIRFITLSDIYDSTKSDFFLSLVLTFSLTVNVRIWCDDGFYGERCEIPCVAGETNACDPDTGAKYCLLGEHSWI